MKLNRFMLVSFSALLASGLFVPTALWAETNGFLVRLAIIPESTASAPVADLLTVELSSKPGLQMLERAEIEKAYREQALSAANRDILKLGQVLGADGLLLLTPASEGPQESMQVRLVAVKPGVVIGAVRSAWPVSDTIGLARWLANHFSPLFPKLGVQPKDAQQTPLMRSGLILAYTRLCVRPLQSWTATTMRLNSGLATRKNWRNYEVRPEEWWRRSPTAPVFSPAIHQ